MEERRSLFEPTKRNWHLPSISVFLSEADCTWLCRTAACVHCSGQARACLSWTFVMLTLSCWQTDCAYTQALLLAKSLFYTKHNIHFAKWHLFGLKKLMVEYFQRCSLVYVQHDKLTYELCTIFLRPLFAFAMWQLCANIIQFSQNPNKFQETI